MLTAVFFCRVSAQTDYCTSLCCPPHPFPPLSMADWIHSSSDTSEDIIKLQFGKLNTIICRYKESLPQRWKMMRRKK